MRVLKIIFWVVYRIWFYVLVGLPIIVLLPFLMVSILRESWYPFFFKLARLWARSILFGMGFRVKIERDEVPDPKKSYMFIANHTSMADIMLMLVTVKNPFVFVGKAELVKIPLFGFFYKRTCILVDRNNPQSRQAVFKRAQRRLHQGLSICIFPEGGVPDEHVVMDGFKDGAFRLAINQQIPIVPIAFADNKKRFSFTFLSGSPGQMRVKMLPFVATEGLTSKDAKTLNQKLRETIFQQLKKFH
jgi:1-acyl-sn-glycerol-3-phosphate acyltransferase